MTRYTSYNAGDWNAICYQCGRKQKASEMRKHWQGYYLCPEHWEQRHPQDFVKGQVDDQLPPWVQPPPADDFIVFCTLEGSSSYVGLAVAGCMRAGFAPSFSYAVALFCTLEGSSSYAGLAVAGCMQAGFTPSVS